MRGWNGMERLVVMRPFTRFAATVSTCVVALAFGVFATGGAAYADFRGATMHNVRTGRCVAADIGGVGITQQLCDDAPGQLWTYIGNPFTGPVQVRNSDTGLCMDISAFQNAGAVV